MRILLFPLLLFLLITPLSAQYQSIPAVDELFAEWDKTNSPGCALAVVRNGQIIYKRGYGLADLEHFLPIQPNTVFYIGSVSKQFVTMCMLLLEERGDISLDDDVRTYFPELPDYGTPITIRNLIHHTSGIRDYLTLWSLAGHSYLDNMEPEVVYDLICRQKELNFEPGTKYLYSNSCYFMMALLVEKVTGQSIRDFARQYIFDPLGMEHTQFYDDNRILIANRAFSYEPNEEGGFHNLPMRFDLVGSGGIYSTVEDLFKWDQNFYENRLGEQREELIAKMLTNGKYKDGSEVNYAFALVNGDYRGLRTVSHSGALAGYRAFYVRFPEQSFSVIILSNLSNLNPIARAYEVAEYFLSEDFTEPLKEKDSTTSGTQEEEALVTNLPLTADQAQKLPGKYYSEEINATYTISIKDGKLTVEVQSGLPTELKQPEANIFTDGLVKMRLNPDYSGFELDAGRVTNLKFVKQ